MKQIPTTQSTGILAYIDRFTEKIENGIMSFGLLAISAIVFANVIARYFLGIPLPGRRSYRVIS